MGRLPEVPTLDMAPREDAAAIVAQARDGAAPPGAEPSAPLPRKTSKLSGAQRKKVARAKERGEPIPRFEPRLVPPREPRDDPPPAAPAAAALPTDESAPKPEPAAEPPRLMPDDVAAAQAARVQEQHAHALAPPRLTREQLEERVGRLAQFVFTGVGFALGDRELEIWPLSDAQESNMGELLVEAWPDEAAKMMSGPNNIVRLLAVGTVARLAWEKLQLTRQLKQRPRMAPGGDYERAPASAQGRPVWNDGTLDDHAA